MTLQRRSFLGGASAFAMGATLTSSVPACAQMSGEPFTPERFGARGDGVTNDSRAFARLAAAVNAAGGGIVQFRRTTYIVGGQDAVLDKRSVFSFQPRDLLEFLRCSKPLILRGNGARIKCAPGLRYGTFEARSGVPTSNRLPFTGSQIATPYAYMIKIEQCSGPVEVADLELDGSEADHVLGGLYGDRGRQIAASGLALVDNSGDEIVDNVYSHHHALDGLRIDGVTGAKPSSSLRQISRLRSEYNGRQGCSIVGGRGYRFKDCVFGHTGKGGVASPPGAGVDIEAQGGKTNRDFAFERCTFIDNEGCGVVADSGDSAEAQFTGCRFVGTTNWAVWPKRPRFTFRNCEFLGAISNMFGSSDPTLATQFQGCRFRDDPALSPTREIFLPGPIADVASAQNVLFKSCVFSLTGKGRLPWSTRAIYVDCDMRQTNSARAHPRGQYRGRNVIHGNVNLAGSSITGELTVNGVRRR